MSAMQLDIFLKQAHELAGKYSHNELLNIFKKPLVILSAPRAGSTLLFETLKTSDNLWSIGGESHMIFNAFPQLHPLQKKFNSGALNAKNATPELCHIMRAFFLLLAINNKGQRYLDLPIYDRSSTITLIEKTPRNALNISFMEKLFPGMRTIFLHRDPRENISSIIEAWELGLSSGRFVTFNDLPGWDRKNWCLLLPPGWRKMNGKSIAEIATFQWVAANEAILNDLQKVDSSRWMTCDFRELVDKPAKTIAAIAEFAQIPHQGSLLERSSNTLPLSNTTVTSPKRDKWKRHVDVIEPLVEAYAPLHQNLIRLSSS